MRSVVGWKFGYIGGVERKRKFGGSRNTPWLCDGVGRGRQQTSEQAAGTFGEGWRAGVERGRPEFGQQG